MGETLRKRPFTVVKKDDINVRQLERIFKHYDERILELDQRTSIDTIADGLSNAFEFSLPTLIAGGLTNTKRITVANSPYVVQPTDHKIYCNTASGAIIILLPVGVNGREIVVYNTTNTNLVTTTPNAAELLDGVNASKAMGKGVIVLTYETIEGWW